MSCDSAVVESVDRQRFVVVEWKKLLRLMIVVVVVVLLLLFLLLLVLVVWTLRKASFEFASEFAFERDKRVVIVVWHGFADVVYLKRSILVVASVSEL